MSSSFFTAGVSEDNPKTDWSFPPSIVPVTIPSKGKNMNGVVYIAQGEQLHPTVILLHGYPGDERNIDLAQIIRRLGWNVLIFHYRGLWGSEGVFSFRGAIDDVNNAVDFLLDPDNAMRLRVNVSDIALLGHSMGGYLALMVGAFRREIHHIGCLAGVNLGQYGVDYVSTPRLAHAHLDAASSGAAVAVDRHKDLLELGNNFEFYDWLRCVNHLEGKSLLLVAALRDEDTPCQIHYQPIVEKMKEHKEIELTYRELDSDHFFSNSRIALANTVAEWLTQIEE